MRWRVTSLALSIGLIAAGQAGAQTGAASHPCALLTAAQVSAAVGRVGESKEGDMPGKAAMRACSYGIPGGYFTLMVGKVPNTNMSTRQLLDWMNTMFDVLKGQGWKLEKRDFGGTTSCSLLTPPAGDANSSPVTTCAAVAKGMLVMASASSKASIPAEKVKSLAETAAARLP